MAMPEQKSAQDYDIIPVAKEIYADVITPISLLRKIAQVSKRYFLLESIEGGERWGRYSFIGFEPVMRVTCKDGTVTIDNGQTKTVRTRKPLEVVRELLARYRSPRVENLPPFTGGFVGYFSYNMFGYAEPVLDLGSGDLNDFDLMLFDKVIAYDQLRQKIVVIANMPADSGEEGRRKALDDIDHIIDLIEDDAPQPEPPAKSGSTASCNLSKEEYCAMVEKAKEYIRAGDIFQAVLSRRFAVPYEGGLLSAYRVLRTTNPSPYMVFMRIDDTEIMCSSPETLVKLEDGRLATFPVAGSRPRGKDAAEDAALAAELLADEKELAEHNMLVDLARNDIGRIAEFSSVKVKDYLAIHRYSKIMHLASEVEGRLKEGLDACAAIEAVLPAGTLSGAPKIRACQIIEELEGEPRGLYGGAIGYLDFSGNLDTCIAIRMAVKKDGIACVQTGGGIVADSTAEKEYEESGHKAQAVINAILQASEVDI